MINAISVITSVNNKHNDSKKTDTSKNALTADCLLLTHANFDTVYM